MTQLCETCLISVSFGWSEVACAECAQLAVSGPAVDAECFRLIAFGWEDAACSRCRGETFEAEGLAFAA
jgi:hypothetical protein